MFSNIPPVLVSNQEFFGRILMLNPSSMNATTPHSTVISLNVKESASLQ